MLLMTLGGRRFCWQYDLVDLISWAGRCEPQDGRSGTGMRTDDRQRGLVGNGNIRRRDGQFELLESERGIWAGTGA